MFPWTPDHAPAGIAAVRDVSLSKVVREDLLGRILRGGLAPGSRINEPDVADYWQPQDGMKAYSSLLKASYAAIKTEDIRISGHADILGAGKQVSRNPPASAHHPPCHHQGHRLAAPLGARLLLRCGEEEAEVDYHLREGR